MPESILETLDGGFVLADGGNVEELRLRGYSAPFVLEDFPDAVRLVHQDFFRAGAGVIRTLTGRCTRTGLGARENGSAADRVDEMNRTAVALAKGAAGGEALVAGTLAPTGAFQAEDAGCADRARTEWEEQAVILADAGVDLLVCESFDRLDEARLALACCRNTALPVVVSVDVALPEGRLNKPALREDEVTADGVAPAECARVLAGDGADVVGAGGMREPEDLWPVVLEMRNAVDAPIAFLPNGYRTCRAHWEHMREGMHVYGIEMGQYALKAVAHDIRFVGGSDGVVIRLLRSMAQALDCERIHIELRPR
ncbi:MAG: homocysteine S-methyltransferase family protein [Gemmatimonadota bacterium]|nr:homocysteine S-methyltransferase family protein [Gemmatimonadota bacterium]